MTAFRLPGRPGAALCALVLAVTLWSGRAGAGELSPAMAATLGPGQYQWGDDTGDGQLFVAVSLAAQRLYVYRGSVLIGLSAISTGMPGHRTPPGDFRILQKRRWHRSNLYSNAPMPFMQRLTWDGIAIHAGHDPGWPASHGCIRVPAAFARTLFAITEIGGAVSVRSGLAEAPVSLPWGDLLWITMDNVGVVGGDGAIRLDYAPEVLR